MRSHISALWLYLLYISIFSCSVLYLMFPHVFNYWMFELSSLEFGVADLNLIWMLYFIILLINNCLKNEMQTNFHILYFILESSSCLVYLSGRFVLHTHLA